MKIRCLDEKIYKALKQRKKELDFGTPFHVDFEFEELCKHEGLNPDIAQDSYDKFLILWTFINKDKEDWFTTWYENIIIDPFELVRIRIHCGFKLEEDKVKKFSSSLFKFTEEEVNDFWNRCIRLNIQWEVTKILNTSKNSVFLEEMEVLI